MDSLTPRHGLLLKHTQESKQGQELRLGPCIASSAQALRAQSVPSAAPTAAAAMAADDAPCCITVLQFPGGILYQNGQSKEYYGLLESPYQGSATAACSSRHGLGGGLLRALLQHCPAGTLQRVVQQLGATGEFEAVLQVPKCLVDAAMIMAAGQVGCDFDAESLNEDGDSRSSSQSIGPTASCSYPPLAAPNSLYASAPITSTPHGQRRRPRVRRESALLLEALAQATPQEQAAQRQRQAAAAGLRRQALRMGVRRSISLTASSMRAALQQGSLLRPAGDKLQQQQQPAGSARLGFLNSDASPRAVAAMLRPAALGAASSLYDTEHVHADGERGDSNGGEFALCLRFASCTAPVYRPAAADCSAQAVLQSPRWAAEARRQLAAPRATVWGENESDTTPVGATPAVASHDESSQNTPAAYASVSSPATGAAAAGTHSQDLSSPPLLSAAANSKRRTDMLLHSDFVLTGGTDMAGLRAPRPRPMRSSLSLSGSPLPQLLPAAAAASPAEAAATPQAHPIASSPLPFALQPPAPAPDAGGISAGSAGGGASTLETPVRTAASCTDPGVSPSHTSASGPLRACSSGPYKRQQGVSLSGGRSAGPASGPTGSTPVLLPLHLVPDAASGAQRPAASLPAARASSADTVTGGVRSHASASSHAAPPPSGSLAPCSVDMSTLSRRTSGNWSSSSQHLPSWLVIGSSSGPGSAVGHAFMMGGSSHTRLSESGIHAAAAACGDGAEAAAAAAAVAAAFAAVGTVPAPYARPAARVPQLGTIADDELRSSAGSSSAANRARGLGDGGSSSSGHPDGCSVSSAPSGGSSAAQQDILSECLPVEEITEGRAFGSFSPALRHAHAHAQPVSSASSGAHNSGGRSSANLTGAGLASSLAAAGLMPVVPLPLQRPLVFMPPPSQQQLLWVSPTAPGPEPEASAGEQQQQQHAAVVAAAPADIWHSGAAEASLCYGMEDLPSLVTLLANRGSNSSPQASGTVRRATDDTVCMAIAMGGSGTSSVLGSPTLGQHWPANLQPLGRCRSSGSQRPMVRSSSSGAVFPKLQPDSSAVQGGQPAAALGVLPAQRASSGFSSGVRRAPPGGVDGTAGAAASGGQGAKQESRDPLPKLPAQSVGPSRPDSYLLADELEALLMGDEAEPPGPSTASKSNAGSDRRSGQVPAAAPASAASQAAISGGAAAASAAPRAWALSVSPHATGASPSPTGLTASNTVVSLGSSPPSATPLLAAMYSSQDDAAVSEAMVKYATAPNGFRRMMTGADTLVSGSPSGARRGPSGQLMAPQLTANSVTTRNALRGASRRYSGGFAHGVVMSAAMGRGLGNEADQAGASHASGSAAASDNAAAASAADRPLASGGTSAAGQRSANRGTLKRVSLLMTSTTSLDQYVSSSIAATLSTATPATAAAAASAGGPRPGARVQALLGRISGRPGSHSAVVQQAASPVAPVWHKVHLRVVRDGPGRDRPAGQGGEPMTVTLTQVDVTEQMDATGRLQRLLEQEHKLLESVFPRHVIEYMTLEQGAGQAPGQSSLLSLQENSVARLASLATAHPCVTLLFADIVGFTGMCKDVPPLTVMTFLNTLYSRFDALLDIYKVYKVETIGDCYLVAGGLVANDDEGCKSVLAGTLDTLHAVRVLEFAKAMKREIRTMRMPHTGEPLAMRVGLHSGPVMSGVVGQKMPRFCLFGDTVNTASRMESTCPPGTIHASAATHELLARERWRPSGGLQVKGKGHMETFIWEGDADELDHSQMQRLLGVYL